jgi:ACS family allantoate permease-like MFS transporter
MANATEAATVPRDMEKETAVSDSSSPSGLKGKINEKLQKHSHDADAAMKAFEGMDGQVIELTEEKSKALLRKIDRHLMPVRLPELGLAWHTNDKIDYVHCLRLELP